MTKEQNTSNLSNDLRTNTTDDLLSSSLTLPRTGPYRSLSAKRPRDPSHRKSVSFNDVPIVHEVPSNDAMRNSNYETYRSWTYTDATAPTSIIPSYYTSQIFSPFNSSNATAQRLHANRLSSSLYSTPLTTATSSSSTTTPSVAASTAALTTTTTTTTTPTRIPEWAIRNKTPKATLTIDDSSTTLHEHPANPSFIVVHTSDDKTNKDLIIKPNVTSTHSNSHFTHSQHYQTTPIPIPTPPTITVSSLTANHENGDEKKHPYRSALVPDTEHYRTLPFTYGTLSDSTATYTSMLSTNLIQSNHSSNEQPITGHTRMARARSATLPVNVTHSSARTSDTVSITPFRATTAALVPGGSNASSRTVLRPTTIAFQCSQPTTTSTITPSNTSTNSLTFHTTMTNNNINTTNLSPTSTSIATTTAAPTANNSTMTLTTTNTTHNAKPPAVPPRYSSAASGGAHSRFIFPPNRPFNAATLTSSAIKYAFAHPTVDSTSSNSTIPRPPPTAYPRSRSAHVLGARRIAAASPVVMLDGHTNSGTNSTSTTNASSNLYATSKRNPNVRQTYGSYYMHRVLLPTTIN